MFKGDSGKSEYTIEVTKGEGTDRDWGVSGEIVVTNPAPYPATIERVEDQIIGLSTLVVECDVEFPYELSSGETLTCTYEAPLSDGTTQVNSATVVTSGDVNGNTTTADIVFGEPTTKVNDKINVSDSNSDGTWGFSDDGSVSYEETFTCNEDEGNHENTATIDETGQADSASVDVKCNEIEVKKDAETSFDRKWVWEIDKSADQTDLLLSDGQLFDVNYKVKVDAEKNDSNFEVKGTITVENPADIDAKILGVSDVISGFDGDVDVDCDEIEFPYTLTAGEGFECEYSADMDDKEDRINTAKAEIQNYSYDKDKYPTDSGTTKFKGEADVIFSKTPDNVTDNCIEVSDTNTGYLGMVCSVDDLPKTYEYILSFGKHDDADVKLECGDNTHINIASFVTNDTETTGEDSWSVDANVECDIGCTLTQGYWKTHSKYGKAPYDETWALIGEDTAFFSSGQTYYKVLWTAPKRGNVYYQLAHQYIAALLNQYNEATVPDKVQKALDDATALFATSTYTPVTVEKIKGKDKALWTDLASILASYNEGDIGPGHCSE
ncbi:hypothetical protein K0B04_00930 [Patescibacteria group bacterium]|nr:hypothetical protein [Patescibacteria group bacterium]